VGLEDRLRRGDALGGVGRQQGQAAERGLDGAAQAVVEAHGGGAVRQLVDGSAGCGIDDLAVGLRDENFLGVGIGRQPVLAQRADDRKGERIARRRDRADRFLGIGKFVIGEFGDRVLERAREGRQREGGDQKD